MSKENQKNETVVSEVEGLRRDVAKLKTLNDQLNEEKRLLKESLERYHTILERLEEGYYEIDNFGNFTFFNESMRNMFGYTREELLGMNNRKYTAPETVIKMNNISKDIYKTGKAAKIVDYEIVRKDGARRMLELSASPLRDPLGAQVGLCGVARDVTKRKKAEKKLIEAEKRLSEIVNFLPDATFAIDREGNVIAWSRTMEKMTCIKARAIINKGNYEYALPFYGKRRPMLVDLVFLENKEMEDTYPFIHRGKSAIVAETNIAFGNGRTVTLWTKASAIYDSEGKIVGAIESLRDISAPKNAEKKLRKSEEKYRTLLESIDEGYFEVDLSGTFTFVNDVLCKIFRYSRGELLEMSNKTYTNEQTVRKLKKVFKNIYKTGFPAKVVDFDIMRGDGEARILEMSVSIVKDSSENPSGFRGILRDVTDRKQMEIALAKRERELEIKSRNLEEANTALKVLLKQREEDKKELEQSVLANVKQLIKPFMEKLETTKLDENQKICVDTVNTNLDNIVSPFLHNMGLHCYRLTPQEIHIANLVKEGKTTKEIAGFLNLSTRTVEFHRDSLRNKFGLKNKKNNLRSYLITLS